MPELNELQELNKLTGNINSDFDSPKKDDFNGIYIFLSFDLANSTSFKNLNPDWPEKIKMFREYCARCMKQYFRSAETPSDTDCCNIPFHTWKLLGDEIIFMFPNPDFEELFKLPDICCLVLNYICNSMETPTKNNNVTLSVKATLWLAEIGNKNIAERDNKTYKNESLESPYQKRNLNIAVDDSDHRMVDFLGPDIDTGFRLSHYSCHNKLAIDARLAWILYSNESKIPTHNKMRTNSKIVSFKVLKGVWNEKPYPIVWYLNDWKSENMFYYFEELDKNHLGYEISSNKYQYEEIDKLEKILIEAKQLDYANYLSKRIKENSKIPIKKLEKIYGLYKTSELHLIAICINEQNEILLLKRSPNREFMPNIWDFGCTYLKNETSILDSLRYGYKEKIGCMIELEDNSIPIATLSIVNKDSAKTEALVYKAKIKKSEIIESEIINKNKYSKVKWLSKENYIRDDYIAFDQENTNKKELVVPDFFDRINDIFQNDI